MQLPEDNSRNIKLPESVDSTLALLCLYTVNCKNKKDECSIIELNKLVKCNISLDNALLTISDEFYKNKEIMLYDM